MGLDHLIEKATRLQSQQIDILCQVADAFGCAAEVWVNPVSDLMRDGFDESFLNRLRAHHAITEEKLSKVSFEFCFIAANRLAGRNSVKTESSTYSGADVVIDGVRWSLKTEGSKKMSRTGITFSKFSEARWIRDCQTGSDFERATRECLLKHLAEYDRIVTLRGAYVDVKGAISVRYELIEIPHQMLMAVENLTDKDYSARTEAGSSSATVKYNGKKAFKVSLDGSVEKVTLSGIQISQCFTHGRWTVPILIQGIV